MKPTPTPTQEMMIEAYDAGLLNDFGGGDVSWWQDYLRAELERAHEFYASQFAALSVPAAEVVGEPVGDIAYNAGLEIRYAIATSGVDPIQHIPEVDAIIERRLAEARKAAFVEAARLAKELTEQRSAPYGHAYTCGTWDHGVRIEKALLALVAKDDPDLAAIVERISQEAEKQARWGASPEQKKRRLQSLAAAMLAGPDLLTALKEFLRAETVAVHVGYDDGPGGGNYVYADAIRTDSEEFERASALVAKVEGGS